MHRSIARLTSNGLAQRAIAPVRARCISFPIIRTPVPYRDFSKTSTLLKKKDKAKAPPPSESPSKSSANAEDLFDLSQLETGITTAVTRLKDDLSKLRAGGRFNTASLEGLKVQLGKESHDSFRLRDLAQVVPKGGRLVTLLVAEEEVRLNTIEPFVVPRIWLTLFDGSMSNQSTPQ